MTIADVRDGVIPQRLRIHVRSLGGFDDPLGQGGADLGGT